ncbi:MAG TPA: 30S ribosomal protein S2 [Verrucomicrobiae bacterium]|nr:30S ribosomal protein S2 [Verrucomicrobiae bacterium]
MPVATLTELLQAGVHFGHQTSRWNPKMRPFLFAERGGIHIIDVAQTVDRLDAACGFAHDTVAQGGQLLFVGTKKQAQDTLVEECQRSGQFFVVTRWLGGMLTNFEVIKRQLRRLADLREMRERGDFGALPKKEASRLEDEMDRLERNFGGIAGMRRLPAALFVVDPHKERLAVTEARKLRVPIVAITDSNCDPDEIDWVIPGNDDAIRSVRLIVQRLTDACVAGLDQRRQIDAARAAELQSQQLAQAAEAAAAAEALAEAAAAAAAAPPGPPAAAADSPADGQATGADAPAAAGPPA